VDQFFPPIHLQNGHLAPGQEVVIGPFPTPGQVFDSTFYRGIIGNLTASNWKGHGWMSIRPNGTGFDPVLGAINLHFGGKFVAWSNFFICQFGFGQVGQMSDGKFILHNGPAPADYLIDLHGLLGPDQ